MKKIPTLFDGENDKYRLLSRLIWNRATFA